MGLLAVQQIQGVEITVMFWNTWFELQDGTRGDGTAIYNHLEELVREHNPLVIGLNEVYRVNPTTESVIERVLHAHGYKTQYEYLIQSDKEFVIGNVIAYKGEVDEIGGMTFGEQYQPTIRWYHYYRPTVVRMRLTVNDKPVQILVPHLPVMVWGDKVVHYRQRVEFNSLIHSIGLKNTIIGGDFNEPKLTVRFFGIPEHFKHLSGGLFRPTWRVLAKSNYLLRGNFDHILFDTKNDLKLRHFEVLDPGPSDHSPLLARFEVR